jgi:hypothetical protein
VEITFETLAGNHVIERIEEGSLRHICALTAQLSSRQDGRSCSSGAAVGTAGELRQFRCSAFALSNL